MTAGVGVALRPREFRAPLPGAVAGSEQGAGGDPPRTPGGGCRGTWSRAQPRRPSRRAGLRRARTLWIMGRGRLGEGTPKSACAQRSPLALDLGASEVIDPSSLNRGDHSQASTPEVRRETPEPRPAGYGTSSCSDSRAACRQTRRDHDPPRAPRRRASRRRGARLGHGGRPPRRAPTPPFSGPAAAAARVGPGDAVSRQQVSSTLSSVWTTGQPAGRGPEPAGRPAPSARAVRCPCGVPGGVGELIARQPRLVLVCLLCGTRHDKESQVRA